MDIRCTLVLSAVLASCGSSPPPPPPAPAKPQATVFDDLVEKKRTLPAAVEKAQQQHMEALRREADEAGAGAGADAEPKR
jgi:hypothetical protein